MRFMERVAQMLMPAPRQEMAPAEAPPTKTKIDYTYPAGLVEPQTASWSTTPISPSSITYQQLSALRARSREQYRSSDYIKRYARLVRSNVVGPHGIRYQSYAKSADGSLDIELSARAESEISQWMARDVDYFREQSWADFLGTLMLSVAIDGEIFARIRSGTRAGRGGLSVQFIDPELIPVQDFRQLQNGNMVRFGIEFDSNDRVVAYHIHPTYAYGYSMAPQDYGRINNRILRIPARNMLHIYDKEYVGQVRGFPWTSTGIARTWQMSKWDEAALVNARYGAAKMVFFKSPDGQGVYDEGKWPNGYRVTKVVPGSAEMLPEGVEPVAFDPTYPSSEYESFSSRNLRGAASGLNVAYESLANDRKGVNFSSIRAGVQEDRESWREVQQFVIRNFCEPLIQRYFLAHSLDPESVFFNLTQYPNQFEDTTAHKWQTRTWAPVDPVKDINASKTEIEMGVKSRSQHMVDMGRDPAETWEQIRKEREVMEELGIRPVESSEVDVMGDEENEN